MRNVLSFHKEIPYEWVPWANTLLYLPLESDVVDKSGKTWRTFTTSWLSYTTVGGVSSAHTGTTWWAYLTAPSPLVDSSIDKTKQTISIWFYVTTQQSSSRRILYEFAKNWAEYFALVLKENSTNIQYSDSYAWYWSWTTIVANKWNNVIVTADTTERNIYVNWALAWTWSAWNTPPRWSWTSASENAQWILCSRNWNYDQALNWNARELIIEDKKWTAEQVTKYYNRSKSNYQSSSGWWATSGAAIR